MRVALVADWLTTFGGAEHVLWELHRLWPEAPIYTTVTRQSALGPLASADIRTTSLQKWYQLLRHHQLLLPLMPRSMEEIDLRGYDLIVSSSHAVAKGTIPPPSAVHVCYCHTPMRYAWEMEEQYFDDFRIPQRVRPVLRRMLKRIRRWDLTTAKRVDYFIANSTTTRERIRRIYNRESVVVPPPVHDRFFQTPLQTTHYKLHTHPYFLSVSRFVPYKRIDLLIAAANTAGFLLKVAGAGHDRRTLQKMAGPMVTFLGHVPDDELPALYAHAQALLFPALEDAGLVPMEAQACGTPVIAYGKGGSLDAVHEGETGLFFSEQSVPAILRALERFRTVSWNPERIREHARQFSAEKFREKVSEEVERVTEQCKKRTGGRPSVAR